MEVVRMVCVAANSRHIFSNTLEFTHPHINKVFVEVVLGERWAMVVGCVAANSGLPFSNTMDFIRTYT